MLTQVGPTLIQSFYRLAQLLAEGASQCAVLRERLKSPPGAPSPPLKVYFCLLCLPFTDVNSPSFPGPAALACTQSLTAILGNAVLPAYVLLRAEVHRQQRETPREAVPLFHRHRPARKPEARLEESSDHEHSYGLRKRPQSADHDSGRR